MDANTLSVEIRILRSILLMELYQNCKPACRGVVFAADMPSSFLGAFVSKMTCEPATQYVKL